MADAGRSDDLASDALKALSKSDLLVPKLPIIDPGTNKRQDGRVPEDVRPLYVQTGVRTGVRGSSYIEMGTTKVICVVNGPKDLSRKIEFSSTGLLSVDIQAVGSKVPEKDIILVKEALEAVIILEKFPKCLLEVSLTILEDAGSTIPACITASGLALMQAGVPIYDLPVGTSLLFEGSNIFVDPTKLEVEALDLTESIRNQRGGGILTMGYLPSREQICLFTMEGKAPPEFLSQCIDKLTEMSAKVFAVIRHHSTQQQTSMDAEHSTD